MSVETKPVHAFTRRPLATLGKFTAFALFGSTVAFLAIVILIGEPILALLIIAACLLVVSGIVVTGIRWAPLLGSLIFHLFQTNHSRLAMDSRIKRKSSSPMIAQMLVPLY